MTLIIIKDEFNWVATSEKIVNTALVSVLVFRRPVFSRASSRPHTRANERENVHSPRPNPCSEYLIPPVKKHMPITRTRNPQKKREKESNPAWSIRDQA